MLSVSLTSPLMASVACMLSIPLSGLTDALLWGDSFPPLAYLGSVLVVAGFALLTLADVQDAKRQAAERRLPPDEDDCDRLSAVCADEQRRLSSTVKPAPFQPLDGGLKPL